MSARHSAKFLSRVASSREGGRHPKRSRTLRAEPLEPRCLLANWYGSLVHDNEDLFSVDVLGNMDMTYLGKMDFGAGEAMFDVAFSPGGQLYGVAGQASGSTLTGPSKLYEINPNFTNPGGTIPTQLVGNVTDSTGSLYLTGLGFRKDGSLFGAGQNSLGKSYIYAIGAQTGNAQARTQLKDQYGVNYTPGDVEFDNASVGSNYSYVSTTNNGALLGIQPSMSYGQIYGYTDHDFYGLSYSPASSMFGYRSGGGVYRIIPYSDPYQPSVNITPVGTLSDPRLGSILGATTYFVPLDRGGEQSWGLDLGDAPAPYPTNLADDGARHTTSALFLGTTVDVEPDGQPNATATGDDSNASADGVAFAALIQGQTAPATITASDFGFVDGWIDFDQSGTWDADEQVFESEPVVAGENLVFLEIPWDAVAGDTYARFRISTTGGLQTTGYAEGGEVEDYQLTIEERNLTDTIGMYDPTAVFNLKNDFGPGLAPDHSLIWGQGTVAGYIPIAGDWDGDGVDTIGLYDPNGTFHFKNDFSSDGAPDMVLDWGEGTSQNWLPVAGDWDGDGIDTVGLYAPNGVFLFKNDFSSGAPDDWLVWGWGTDAGYFPIAGDWDGDGVDTIGLYGPNAVFSVKNDFNSGGAADDWLVWGWGTVWGYVPIAGDWDGNGVDTIGVYDPNAVFSVKNDLNPGGVPDDSLVWGRGTAQGWLPLAGNWDATRISSDYTVNVSDFTIGGRTPQTYVYPGQTGKSATFQNGTVESTGFRSFPQNNGVMNFNFDAPTITGMQFTYRAQGNTPQMTVEFRDAQTGSSIIPAVSFTNGYGTYDATFPSGYQHVQVRWRGSGDSIGQTWLTELTPTVETPDSASSYEISYSTPLGADSDATKAFRTGDYQYPGENKTVAFSGLLDGGLRRYKKGSYNTGEMTFDFRGDATGITGVTFDHWSDNIYQTMGVRFYDAGGSLIETVEGGTNPVVVQGQGATATVNFKSESEFVRFQWYGSDQQGTSLICNTWVNNVIPLTGLAGGINASFGSDYVNLGVTSIANAIMSKDGYTNKDGLNIKKVGASQYRNQGFEATNRDHGKFSFSGVTVTSIGPTFSDYDHTVKIPANKSSIEWYPNSTGVSRLTALTFYYTKPLVAAGGVVAGGDVATLGQAELQPIVNQAIAGWEGVGLATEQIEALLDVDVIVTDLPGAQVGLATFEAIYLDIDAAGHGWFIDPTPGGNEEFLAPASGGLQAVDPQAVDRMDLLTVVSHELGHMLGLADLDSSIGSLMSGTLETGLRREPGAAEIDALFAQL